MDRLVCRFGRTLVYCLASWRLGSWLLGAVAALGLAAAAAGVVWWAIPAGAEPTAAADDDLPVPPVPPRIAEGEDYDKCLVMLNTDPSGALDLRRELGGQRRRRRRAALPGLAEVALGDAGDGRRRCSTSSAATSTAAPAARAAIYGQAGQSWLMAGDPKHAYASADQGPCAHARRPRSAGRPRHRRQRARPLPAMRWTTSPGRSTLDPRRGDALVLRAAAWRHLEQARSGGQDDVDRALGLDPDDPGRAARARHPAPAPRRPGRRARRTGSGRSRSRPTPRPPIWRNRTSRCWMPGPSGAKHATHRYLETTSMAAFKGSTFKDRAEAAAHGQEGTARSLQSTPPGRRPGLHGAHGRSAALVAEAREHARRRAAHGSRRRRKPASRPRPRHAGCRGRRSHPQSRRSRRPRRGDPQRAQGRPRRPLRRPQSAPRQIAAIRRGHLAQATSGQRARSGQSVISPSTPQPISRAHVGRVVHCPRNRRAAPSHARVRAEPASARRRNGVQVPPPSAAIASGTPRRSWRLRRLGRARAGRPRSCVASVSQPRAISGRMRRRAAARASRTTASSPAPAAPAASITSSTASTIASGGDGPVRMGRQQLQLDVEPASSGSARAAAAQRRDPGAIDGAWSAISLGVGAAGPHAGRRRSRCSSARRQVL